MRLQAIRKLTFAYVRNPKLVARATSWQYSQIEDEIVTAPVRKSQYNYSHKFSESDLDGVDAMIALLNSLDDESLELRLSQVEDQEVDQGKLPLQHLPISLSKSDIDLWAKNASWKRYQAAFLANGFSITERCRDKCESLLFPSHSRDVSFTTQYFPLFEAVINLDKQLVSSPIFPHCHRTYYYQSASAIDLINWFEKMEIPIPKGLADRVRYFQTGTVETDSAELKSPNKGVLHTKERTSMLTLIHALAKSSPFKYDPSDSRNGAISRIQNAIADSGLTLSDPIVRKYLRYAEKEAARLRDKNQ